MSRHHSRSPLHSRTSTLGRQAGYYGEQHHAPVRSDLWRGSENVQSRNVEGIVRWDNGSSQIEEQVDHWAKFIEAINRAEKRKVSSMSRYHAQDGIQSFEEDSPRQLSRERLCSPEALRYGVEMHQRIQSPGQRRNEHEAAHADRRYSRSSSPRRLQGKRHDRVEHGYHNEEHEDGYERSSYSERSLKSNYSEHQLHFKGYQDLDPQEEYTVSHRGFSPHCAPVIVEHDHGIPKHDARIHNPGRERERPRSRIPARERGHPRNPDPGRERERPRTRDLVMDREQPSSGGPVRGQEHPSSGGLVRGREHPSSGGPVRGREHPSSGGPVRGREHPSSGGPVRGREHPSSGGPVRGREHPSSGGPVRGREHPSSSGPVRGQEHSSSSGPVRDREHPSSGGPVRDRERPRNRDPVSQQERPRSHDPGRDQEYPRGGGPIRHQEPPRSHDIVKDREHPRSRDPLRTSDLPRGRDYPKSSEPQRGRDPTGGRESSRSKEFHKHRRDYNHQPGTSHGSPSGVLIREDARFHTSSAERGSPLRGLQHHKEQSRLRSHSREHHGQRAVDDGNFRIDESNRARASELDWDEETQPRGNHGGVLGQSNVLKRNLQHRNPNHPGARMDFAGHETLKIKVDMSRPLHPRSLLGYSSERQLSLDLVNVGRQRLDFLPMLEHSGTFRETPMHSGTFAQEIITLVHQVKENYFQGQGITLNERFSNEQEYSLADEFAEEEQEMDGTRPVVNRLLGSMSLDTQIFCNIGPMQSQSKPHVPAPGDLRHDLERKRQERLEGVKITIAGGNFSQILPQSHENESAYVSDEDPREAGWSREVPQQTEHWDEPRQKRPAQNLNARRNFNRARNRAGARTKKNPNNSARW